MSKKKSSKIASMFRWFVLLFPAVLYFSYWPVISLGANETMNFELSLPLIWLVLFDIIGLALMIQKKVLFTGVRRYWWVLLFPVWISITVVWSLNFVRGLLVAGIVWLLFFAVYAMWGLKSELDEGFRGRFLKWFVMFALVACGWCVIQCILDLVGVSSGYTLLCAGCTYSAFGFPHPNGFAIEPQFMGNLLLAPGVIMAWLYLRKLESKNHAGSDFLCSNFLLVSFFVIVMTLFLTLSRGAIYSFIVAMIFVTGVAIWGYEKGRKVLSLKRLGVIWGVVVLSFLFALNLQGVMAEVSKTDDTYISGVSKVINQLTLGKVDIGGTEVKKDSSGGEAKEDNRGEIEEVEIKGFEESDFDGYVEESTDTRMKLSEMAIGVWSQEPKVVMVGVGLGGAGQALHDNGSLSASKEIVQNQHVSLLLETGIIGVALMVVMMIATVRLVLERCEESILIIAVMIAYLISLCFFSGLPNALQIYLITGILIALFGVKKSAKDC